LSEGQRGGDTVKPACITPSSQHAYQHRRGIRESRLGLVMLGVTYHKFYNCAQEFFLCYKNRTAEPKRGSSLILELQKQHPESPAFELHPLGVAFSKAENPASVLPSAVLFL
jgi:hypothetical protein